VKDEGRDVRAAVLVYPGGGSTAQWLRGRDSAHDPVRLFSLYLPFPQPEDLTSEVTWGRYLGNVGHRLGTQLELVKEDPATQVSSDAGSR
jgi:hypothetical protein